MIGGRLGPMQEKIAEKLVPTYIKDKIDQVDDRIGALETWKVADVSQWATGVDNTLDTLTADQKALEDAQVATKDNLSGARQDAVDKAMSLLAIPEGMTPADLGKVLAQMRDQTKAGGADFFNRTWDLMYATYGDLMDVRAMWVSKRNKLTNASGSGLLDNYSEILNTTYEWRNYYKSPIVQFVDSGTIPAKAQTTIQGWISKQADAIKGTISSAQLSTDKLNAISALMGTVQGTSTKLIDTLPGVATWYNKKEDYIKAQIDSYVSAYNTGTLQTLMENKFAAITGDKDFKTALLAKLGVEDLKEKLKDYLMNIPGVEGIVDTLEGIYEGITGFVDKLIAGLEDAKKRFHYLRVNSIEGNLETMVSVIQGGIKSLKSDLDRDPGEKPANIKQYCKDAVNDVRSIISAAVSSLEIILKAVAQDLENIIAAVYVPVKNFTTTELAALRKAISPDAMKSKIRSAPA